ncbi:MAG: histidine kinase [Cytophagales bacterium CG12_big_fil_rev_8_21_14_0_65_40_12]|nr:MAG: histidine kinase [Cytophagales bacterium CG12_big_fil_rev_8_21_14_0_65_40_12]PIW04593.1 MAG: histidine kinase [Cytophagales bacterium CG17_big_fil_post_rev_8_21_14_2_50_40_13]
MRKRRLYWTFQIIGWALPALINLTLVFVFNNDSEKIKSQFFEAIPQSVFPFFISHFVLRQTIIKAKWLTTDLVKIFPKLLGLILLISFSASMFYQLFRDNPFDKAVILLDFLTAAILFVIWTAIYFLYHYLESNNRSLKYEAAMNEMYLNQLKSQLNPHFIFNALNSVRALVDEDPSKAKIAITQLSNILRNSLIMDKKKVISFIDELNTVKAYLALESIRFEERLKVTYDIDPNSNEFQIPPMMLQTLVENAIKHGVSNLVKGGHIEISTVIKDSVLSLKIRNSGQYYNGIKKPGKKGGYGLSNTKERLQLIYGSQASFNIYNENDKFVITEVKIPQWI